MRIRLAQRASDSAPIAGAAPVRKLIKVPGRKGKSDASTNLVKSQYAALPFLYANRNSARVTWNVSQYPRSSIRRRQLLFTSKRFNNRINDFRCYSGGIELDSVLFGQGAYNLTQQFRPLRPGTPGLHAHVPGMSIRAAAEGAVRDRASLKKRWRHLRLRFPQNVPKALNIVPAIPS